MNLYQYYDIYYRGQVARQTQLKNSAGRLIESLRRQILVVKKSEKVRQSDWNSSSVRDTSRSPVWKSSFAMRHCWPESAQLLSLWWKCARRDSLMILVALRHARRYATWSRSWPEDIHIFSRRLRSNFGCTALVDSHLVIGLDSRREIYLSGVTLSSSLVTT